MILRATLERGDSGTHLPSGLEERGEVEVGRLGVAKRVVDAKEVGTTDHLVDGAESELGHIRPELLGDVVEEVDDVLGLASELGAKTPAKEVEVRSYTKEQTERASLRVLGRDSDGAGVEL